MGSPLTETDAEPSHHNILSTTDGETAFFRSIIRYRPRGPNRHFSMVGICRDLERELHAVVPSRLIWNALRSCYDLDILAEMEPDEPEELDGSKSTVELLRTKQETFFREFQLPIDPSVPAEQSFRRLVDERRLASSSDGSSPEQRPRSPPPPASPRRRTTSNSLKLHILDRPSSAKPKSTPDPNLLQEGMESDLTEQEDYDDDNDDDDLKDLLTKQDQHEDEDEDEDEHEAAPEPRSKKQRTSASNAKSAADLHPQHATPASRSRNTGNNRSASNSTTTIASSSRSRTRARSKR